MALQACSTSAGLVLLETSGETAGVRVSRAEGRLQNDLDRVRVVEKLNDGLSIDRADLGDDPQLPRVVLVFEPDVHP